MWISKNPGGLTVHLCAMKTQNLLNFRGRAQNFNQMKIKGLLDGRACKVKKKEGNLNGRSNPECY